MLANMIQLVGLILLSPVILQCGSQEEAHHHSLEWIKSRQNSEKHAYLVREDLQDQFIFGASVIKVDQFPANALNMVIRPRIVQLKATFEQDKGYLKVIDQKSQQPILTFALNLNRGYYEIDFSSAKNDLNFIRSVEYLGGIFTGESKKHKWMSFKKPSVSSISQDDDTVVVDLKHTVQLMEYSTPLSPGNPVTSGPGEVTLRVWLKRLSSTPPLSHKITVGEAKAHKVGFFGSKFVHQHEDQHPIQRFSLAETITFYLKDVPEKYQEVATNAILSWNKAFDHDVIEVKIAPEHIDAGDPRYHVVKWFDDTQGELGWAGVAKMIVNPENGSVMSGTVYIQGNALEAIYKRIVGFTHRSKDQPQLTGSFGNAFFTSDIGEHPILPFFTDVHANYEDYMQGYYEETIAHEIGHVFGLRHNFKGSSQLDEYGRSASVMDYLPRSHRHRYHGPGFYDIAAIRFGYYAELPRIELPFCTDEDVWKNWDCSKGDYGKPVDYVLNGIKNSIAFIQLNAVAISDDSQISSIAGLYENAHKLWKLKSQMPLHTRLKLEKQLPGVYKSLFSALPDPSLSEEGKKTAQKNIKRMQKLVKEKVTALRSAGTI